MSTFPDFRSDQPTATTTQAKNPTAESGKRTWALFGTAGRQDDLTYQQHPFFGMSARASQANKPAPNSVSCRVISGHGLISYAVNAPPSWPPLTWPHGEIEDEKYW
jgi:hypothetical protein